MKPLGQPYRNIVYGTDWEWFNHYPDKFRARQGVMLHAVRLGWSLASCRAVFLNPVNPVGVGLRTAV